jgi:ABC-type Na+ transport system ATPase subunit NatA
MEKNVKLNKMELKIEIALRKARKKEMEKVVGKTKEVGKEKTLMFSTHIMQEVEAVCDRVIIINKGKMVELTIR